MSCSRTQHSSSVLLVRLEPASILPQVYHLAPQYYLPNDPVFIVQMDKGQNTVLHSNELNTFVSYLSYQLHCCTLPEKRCLSHGMLSLSGHFLNDAESAKNTKYVIIASLNSKTMGN